MARTARQMLAGVETTTDNPRMITIFKQRGFTFDEPDDDEVLVNKVLQDA